jgi:FkbM family methyltransferase
MLPRETKRRLGVNLGVPDLRWSLLQLRRFGFIPKHVMDVGAFKGDWTRACLDIFPEASISCIEPQDTVQQGLQKLMSKHSNVKVIKTLLGRSIREDISFEEIGSGSSVLLNCGRGIKKPMTTIDELVRNEEIEPADLIKLDVQGYEIEVLEGWSIGFDRCQVIQTEISLLPIVQGASLLYEVVSYLYGRGFAMFDIDELIRAPSDGTVWQIDAIFCRIESPLRNERVWGVKASSIGNY